VAVDPFRAVVGLWRRSLQARVLIGTVLLSALVVTLVGWTMTGQITDGLVDTRVDAAVEEAGRSTADVQSSLSAATSDVAAGEQVPNLVAGVVSRGLVRGYDVVIAGPLEGGGSGSGGEFLTPGLAVESVPGSLEAVVEEEPSASADGAAAGSWWTFTRIRYDEDTGRESVPGVVVGSRVVLPADGGTYALYHLFPMDDEERTLGLVQRAVLTSGILLLVLVAALSWLATRQIVSPVRLARRVAERLASGRLEERMQVTGEDDIARLAVSFNKMATSLQRQIRRLEDMSAAQRRFVSDVSHELRTPLTTVRMAGDVLYDARERFDPVTARAAELLQNELDRFELLLTDLLEISRFDAGAAVLHLEDVDLEELAHRVVRSVRPLADARRTQVVVRSISEPGAPPAVVEADSRRVERIVRNLVVNAIDYADSSDVLVLIAANAEGSALAVRDYGVGLRPGEEVRVFTRFWRADPARVRTSGGTGLGLSIALEDARLHGGWLQAWGSPGRGSQFRLTLPRRSGSRITRSALPLVPRDARAGRAVVR
jgi:two-component system sensor histidine kinase MtrB